MDDDAISLKATIIYLMRVPQSHTMKMVSRFCVPAGFLKGGEVKTASDLYVGTLFVESLLAPSKVKTRRGKPTKGKSHCCFYCRKMFVEISSHFVRIHSTEKEVVEILKFSPNSKERNAALKVLRSKGDARYNELVLSTQRIPVRCHAKLDLENLVTCPKCINLFSKRNFARHERRCTGRPANYQRVTSEAREIESERFYTTTSKLKSFKERVMNCLIEPIRKDAVFHEIVSDKCLKLATERYAHMHQNSLTSLKNDRQHLRRLGRLLLEIKEIEPSVIDYEDLFKYFNYELIIEAVRSLCAMNQENLTVGKASLATALKSSITFLLNGLIQKHNALKGEQPELEDLQRLKTLHLDNYSIYIGRSAGRVVLQRKAEKPNELPCPRDIKRFTKYMCREADEAFEKLRKEFSYDAWVQLGKAELVKIIIFNRRRVSEVASMSLVLYEQKSKIGEDQKKSLNIIERTLADTYSSMRLIGKRQHILHLLLNEDQCRHLDVFIALRGMAGVPETNTYLFGVPTAGLYIDASNAIREYSFKCGALKPNLLRSTYLRKQVATLSQLLTMNDNQIGQIAKLMGHSQKVHEQVYRQDELLFQVTAWAKFLTIVSTESDLNKFRGKSFEEILQIAENMENFVDDPSQEDHLTATELCGPLELEEQLQDTESEEMLRDTSPAISETARGLLVDSDQSSVTTSQGPTRKSTRPTKRREVTPKKNVQKEIRQTPTKASPTITQILHEVSSSPKKRKKVSFKSEEIKIMQRHFSSYITNGKLAPPAECALVLNQNKTVFTNRCSRDLYNWVQYQRNKRKSL